MFLLFCRLLISAYRPTREVTESARQSLRREKISLPIYASEVLFLTEVSMWYIGRKLPRPTSAMFKV